MCGIIGKVTRQPMAIPLGLANLSPIKHRGPDDQGLYQDSHASLGHVRLSIIDLSAAGHQPMLTPDSRFAIVYNGEVYNYIEVREQLRADGVVFTTQSDTEVVIKAYAHWGPKCLSFFRGMFSLAIWDKQNQTLFMARDRCGEKPFIYAMDEQAFFFSSEFKGLIPLLPKMPELDPSVVDMYLHYQYAPEPYTLLKNVTKLPAAHYAILDVKTWALSVHEYWDLQSIPADPSITKQDLKTELETAIRLCLRSDVQIGVALSAGIDSAGIAAIASKNSTDPLETFCVGYPGRPAYDERAEAKHLANLLGCHFNEVELPTEQFVDSFKEFSLLLDEPIADIAAFGHYAVPKSCADKGIKVLLTGIGGDELFWGYDWARAAAALNERGMLFRFFAKIVGVATKISLFYKILFHLSRSRRIPPTYRTFFRQLLASVDYAGPDDQVVFMAASGAPEFTHHGQIGEGWYGPAMVSLPRYNAYWPTSQSSFPNKKDAPIQVMDLLFKTWLTSNCLSLGDRVSMAVSVETRLPLLDVRLIEKVTAWRKANPDHKAGQKALLRELLVGLLPEATIKRPKSGFVPPVTKWLSSIADRYSGALNQGHLVRQGILQPDITKRISATGDISLSPHTLYRLILLEQWYDGINSLYARTHQNQEPPHENRVLFG